MTDSELSGALIRPSDEKITLYPSSENLGSLGCFWLSPHLSESYAVLCKIRSAEGPTSVPYVVWFGLANRLLHTYPRLVILAIEGLVNRQHGLVGTLISERCE